MNKIIKIKFRSISNQNQDKDRIKYKNIFKITSQNVTINVIMFTACILHKIHHPVSQIYT